MAIGNIGTLTVRQRSYSFFAANTPDGFPRDVPVIQQDRRIGPNNDFVRWFDRGYQYVPYQLTIWIAQDSWSGAKVIADALLTDWWADGIDLTWTIAGTPYSWDQLKINAPPQVRIQRGYASDANGQSATTGALVIATIEIQHTRTPE